MRMLMGASYWAGIALPAGVCVIPLARHPVFSSAKTVKNSRAHCVAFYIGSASPRAEARCSSLGLEVGFRPPRPRLSGVPEVLCVQRHLSPSVFSSETSLFVILLSPEIALLLKSRREPLDSLLVRNAANRNHCQHLESIHIRHARDITVPICESEKVAETARSTL